MQCSGKYTAESYRHARFEEVVRLLQGQREGRGQGECSKKYVNGSENLFSFVNEVSRNKAVLECAREFLLVQYPSYFDRHAWSLWNKAVVQNVL